MFKTTKDKLFEAAVEGDRAEILRLMERGAFDANVKSSLWRGTPILAYAILNQDHILAQHLIDKGANVRAVVDGMPLLHMAKDAKSVHMLIEGGAMVMARMGKEYPGLSKGATALHKAAPNDNHEVLKALIDFGAEIDARDAYGHTPLHFAASRRITNSKALVMAGADPDAESKSGVTPSDLISQTFGFAKSADAWLRERAAALTSSALARFRSGSDALHQDVYSKPPAHRM
ncbi:ankyrin repeat domain-containing protein [Cupriavidus sp. UYPR2.512]|uniref:ankyrin repeat domain-containing protein n=1 Tax=Cupriavidus sp. UYPR2.512 TaxID=1080187 RepID=UPI00036490D7|nr:ankyrin repeat domain-containing protein [Cupriavidus sp. UYPR2.512]UIF89383.1 ankyrin repeat domain-containing protein [Cupriavidus necator]